jgi:hypothetical protein
MNYYILTQGTKSKNDSLIIRDGIVVSNNNDSVKRTILEKFALTDKGKMVKIPSNKKLIGIKRSGNNYLIEILSTNTDRVGRRVPVEIVLDNYNNDTFSNTNLKEIPSILEQEGVLIDKESLELSINLIDKSIPKEGNVQRNMIIVFIVLVILIITLIISKIF